MESLEGSYPDASVSLHSRNLADFFGTNRDKVL